LVQQVESVAIGQAEIENDGVMARLTQGVARLTARADPSDDVRMLPQGSFEKRADAALIFDNQYFRGDGPNRFGTRNILPRTETRVISMPWIHPGQLDSSRPARYR
jgi:hypothetical protein